MATALQKILDTLREEGGLQGRDVANIADVSPATVSRWSAGKAMPDLKTQTMMAELRYVVDRLAELYQPDEIRVFLHTPSPVFGGERAIDLIISGRTHEVLNEIENLDAGAYT